MVATCFRSLSAASAYNDLQSLHWTPSSPDIGAWKLDRLIGSWVWAVPGYPGTRLPGYPVRVFGYTCSRVTRMHTWALLASSGILSCSRELCGPGPEQ
eukprot:96464-Rhodomonas_salina.2